MPRTLSQLSQVLPPTRSGRTFFVASSLLGLVACLQLGFLGWYLARGGARMTSAAKNATPAPVVLPFRETMVPNVAPMDPPNPTPATTAASDDAQNPYATLPGPTPAPAARLPGGASGDALEQARALRQRGDMRAALSRLREALVAEPDNPQAIAELALTYEAMQLADKAAEQWQRLFAMGESVGALYYLADTKLHTVGNVSSSDPAGPRRPGGPTQVDKTVLKITSVNVEEIPDPSVEQKVALKIVVKGLPGVVINPERVKIEAYFYDLLDGKDMVQTDAQTDFAWLSPPPINWANDKSEVLEALYVRPKGVALMPGPPATSRNNGSRRRNGRNDKSKPTPAPEAADSPAPDAAADAPVRKYLGYSVRLYYNGQLQEVQADPVRLLERFQAPLTLPVEEESENPGSPR